MQSLSSNHPALAHSMQILTIRGVRLLYIQNSSFLTNIQILTDVGSMAETGEEMGMAHILEHMFFKGSRKRPEGTSIARAANDLGARMNAYTTYDHTVYYISVLNDTFEEGFDILSDMYLNPLFPPEEFKKEIGPILSEYREREDDPDNFLFERTMEAYYGSGYHPTIGTVESIKGATVRKMHDFKNRYYGANNLLLCIVGGVDLDRVVRAVESMFSSTGNVEKPPQIQLEPGKGRIELTRPAIQEAYYTLLYPSLPPDHPGRFKQDVMNYMLGGNDSALLFERIREEKGMSCYGIYSWVQRHTPFSILGIGTSIEPAELDELEKEVQDQIKRIMDSPLEEHRLKRAKASIRAAVAARSETSAGLASMVGPPVLRGETENPVEKALAILEEITVEDVLESARETFNGPAMTAILLPADTEILENDEED